MGRGEAPQECVAKGGSDRTLEGGKKRKKRETRKKPPGQNLARPTAEWSPVPALLCRLNTFDAGFMLNPPNHFALSRALS